MATNDTNVIVVFISVQKVGIGTRRTRMIMIEYDKGRHEWPQITLMW